jgi:transcriptional regulator with XRE-family HTH domain
LTTFIKTIKLAFPVKTLFLFSMKTLQSLAAELEAARLASGLNYKTLAERTGLSTLAVRQALQGRTALRATNLMALADELGLELALVPSAMAASLRSASEDPAATPRVLSDVERLLARNAAAHGKAP